MTGYLTCPYCGREARFIEHFDFFGSEWLECTLCKALTDDAELMACNAEDISPTPQDLPTCTEAMESIERENRPSRLDVTADCGATGDVGPWVVEWIMTTFIYSHRIEIERMEVHA